MRVEVLPHERRRSWRHEDSSHLSRPLGKLEPRPKRLPIVTMRRGSRYAKRRGAGNFWTGGTPLVWGNLGRHCTPIYIFKACPALALGRQARVAKTALSLFTDDRRVAAASTQIFKQNNAGRVFAAPRIATSTKTRRY